VVFFLLSALLPFLFSFVLFLYSQRLPIFTPPDVYVARLKLDGAALYSPSKLVWKSVLARDALCAEADAVVIGSSRMREVESHVVGSSVCNLYVDGLNALEFEVLTDALLPAPRGRQRTVYVGLDHIFFWWGPNKLEWIDFKVFKTARILWMGWQAIESLGYFSTADIMEAIRRSYATQDARNLQNQAAVWFPDGHVLYPHYYVLKTAGIHRRIEEVSVEESVRVHFGNGGVRPQYLRALKAGLKTLRTKGYRVYLFWEPLSPDYMAAARRLYPHAFQEAIAALESTKARLKIDRYISAQDSLNASRFGCTEEDRPDEVHVDVDCMDHFFAALFRPTSQSTRRLSEALVADLNPAPARAR